MKRGRRRRSRGCCTTSPSYPTPGPTVTPRSEDVVGPGGCHPRATFFLTSRIDSFISEARESARRGGGVVDEDGGCAKRRASAHGVRSLRRDFVMPRPRCSIAAAATTRLGVGRGSVVGGGGCRVAASFQQCGCQRAIDRRRAAARSCAAPSAPMSDARRRYGFRIAVLRSGPRRAHRLADGPRAVVLVVHRGDDVDILCGPARSGAQAPAHPTCRRGMR